MAYNAHSVLRDYYTYEEIGAMPIHGLLSLVNYFTPKLREIARQQHARQLEAELTGKRNQRKPGGIKR